MLKKISQYIDFDSRKGPRSKDSEDINSFGQIKKRDPLAQGFDFLSLIRAWREIAGEKLSEHTIPLKNQHGTLIVLSNHSAFANELKFMELPLKKKIFEKFPNLEKHIQNIKFIVDSTHFEKQYLQLSSSTALNKKEDNKLHPFSPLFRKLKKEAEEVFGHIEDDEMRDRIISLYIQTHAKNH